MRSRRACSQCARGRAARAFDQAPRCRKSLARHGHRCLERPRRAHSWRARHRTGAVPIRPPISGLDFTTGGHPVPTADSERAGRRALALAESTTPDDRFLVLLSGGASALMAVPVAPITLEDKQRTTERLLTQRRRHSCAQHRAEAPFGDQGRTAGGCFEGVDRHVRHFRRGRRRFERHWLGTNRARHQHLRRRVPCHPSVRRSGGLSGPCRSHVKRGIEGDLVETPKPDDLTICRREPRSRHRQPRDGHARRGGGSASPRISRAQ